MSLWTHSEPPMSYILFTGLSSVSACLGRRVWMAVDPGVHRLWPMLNLLLIGDSGIGKSTSIGMGDTMIRGVVERHRPQVIADAATTEKLHKDLKIWPKCWL